MTLNEYQREVRRTAATTKDRATQECVLALGVAGEAGEVAELVKKHVGHGHAMDKAKLLKELGDVLWYVAALADHMNLSLDAVATANIAKLQARYPDGFDRERSKLHGVASAEKGGES
jgi:NTP pyrophosphatase (non-canonical NTP hydrolase)